MEMYGFFMFPLQSNNTVLHFETFGESGLPLRSLPHLLFTPHITAAALHPKSPCWNIAVINNLLIDKCEV